MTPPPATHSLTSLGGHRVLFLMAAPAEFGPHLRARITPHFTGVGPVEAALATTLALSTLDQAQTPPDLVVSLGSAGSARLAHGTVYQASEVAWRDMDASALGFAPGVTPLLDLPAILPLPLTVPGIARASLSTGANVVSGTGYAGIAQDMVDMETYATLRPCMNFDLPLIALRGISDGQSELTGLHDWTDYLPIVDARLAQAVDTLAVALRGGLLA